MRVLALLFVLLSMPVLAADYILAEPDEPVELLAQQTQQGQGQGQVRPVKARSGSAEVRRAAAQPERRHPGDYCSESLPAPTKCPCGRGVHVVNTSSERNAREGGTTTCAGKP